MSNSLKMNFDTTENYEFNVIGGVEVSCELHYSEWGVDIVMDVMDDVGIDAIIKNIIIWN